MFNCPYHRGQHEFAWQGRECWQRSKARTAFWHTPSAPAKPAATTSGDAIESDKQREFFKQILTTIPDGRYAVDPAGGKNYRFYRISRPKHGKYKDAIKVQTQHSDDLIVRAVLWPSGRLWVGRAQVVEDLMVVAVRQTECAVAYGREIGRCCRCAKHLTDPRSRHYGIGPECEGYWPHIIDEVDLMVAEGKLEPLHV